ncbi:methylated-DNA--[protein]-cysteine S-methyltransferase [Pasteurellaceae bacterium HPA106]|uniref:methylated-DNA--[protein]-cysteine S-methyltransferase n=1 Tax=Spirabiliibacterium pneumoniae TaxID=221400 RepID=UPI001AAD1B0A|nr:methylated-DNA--[protein]-cysteine S-methyltransferase [Spirabiliibacterium pneumoniae]MBE2895377.1 methylated-DNA--[protein]-cysteine S-methyltransferase [Spirabiliibacterium pneumoniae]
MYYTALNTPIGSMTLLADDATLRFALFERERPVIQSHWVHAPNHAILTQAITALSRYFAGEKVRFDTLPIAPQGSAFQRQVWQALCSLDYGESVSYGQLAARIGRKSAVRALANAVGQNPIGIIIPCHRVLGKGQTLTGFGGGLPAKRYLLQLENIAFVDRGKEYVNRKAHQGL